MSDNRLLVTHDQWRSSRIYAYCPNCDDVFGVDKGSSQVCPVCMNVCRDIFREIVDRVSRIWEFYESMRVKDGPFGRFRETGSPHPYSLNATYHALEKYHGLTQYGFDSPYSPEQVRRWIDTILLDLNPETGLIDDPFLAEETGRSDRYLARVHNLSNRLAETFAKLGYPEVYRISITQRQAHDHLADERSALAFLEDDLWETEPWGKGSGTAKQVIRHEDLLARTGQPGDGMAEFVHRWLDDRQDPDTGYWFGSRATANNRACGAYKLICWLYRPKGWKVNHLEKIVDTTLALQTPRGDFGDDGYSCQVWDPLLLLKMGLDRLGSYRREEIFQAAARAFLNIKDHWSDEHHTFVSHPPDPPTVQDLMEWGVVTFMAEILLGIPVFNPGQ